MTDSHADSHASTKETSESEVEKKPENAENEECKSEIEWVRARLINEGIDPNKLSIKIGVRELDTASPDDPIKPHFDLHATAV